MPLASPRRRAAALAVDGMVIIAITALTRSLPLLLGVAAATFFIRAGFKRISVRGSVFGRAMRLSVGCLGVFIAIVTAALWTAFGPGLDRGGDTERGSVTSQVVRGLGEMGVFEGIEDAASPEEAQEVADALIEAGREAGLADDVLRRALVGLAPDAADWREEWETEVDALLAPEGDEEAQDVGDTALEVEIAALTDDEAIGRWVRLRGSDEMTDSPEATLLEARIRDLVAGDSLGELEDRISTLDRRLESARREVRELEGEVEAFENRGLLTRLRELADQLGFGFGWAALYMTVVLSWWNGQTIGKRALGIRVVRLDGGPITWWVAFERVGGYAAGFATGLLGFAQVWWDANRQAIHDRIVGTVVIYDGAEKVLDWESAT